MDVNAQSLRTKQINKNIKFTQEGGGTNFR